MVALSWLQLRRRRQASRDAAAAARANQSEQKEKKQALPLEELDCNARSITHAEWLQKRRLQLQEQQRGPSSAESSDSELVEECMTVGATHDCVVCLTPMEGDDVLRETSCAHIFHALCLERWWRRKHHDCPLCRYDLRSEKLKLEDRQKQCVEEPIVYMIF